MFICTSFESFYGVAVYYCTGKPIPYINDFVKKEILRFVRVKVHTYNLAVVTSRVISLVDGELLVAVHILQTWY